MIAFYWFVGSFCRSNFVVQYFKGEVALVVHSNNISDKSINLSLILLSVYVICELLLIIAHFLPSLIQRIVHVDTRIHTGLLSSLKFQGSRFRFRSISEGGNAIFTASSQEEMRGKKKSRLNFRGEAEARQAPRGNGVTFIWSPEPGR